MLGNTGLWLATLCYTPLASDWLSVRRGTHASFLIWGEWQVSRPLWCRNMHYCCLQRLKLDFVDHFYRANNTKTIYELNFLWNLHLRITAVKFHLPFNPFFTWTAFCLLESKENYFEHLNELLLSIRMNSYWAFEWTLIGHSNELLLWGVLGHLDKPINPSWRRGKQKIVYYSLDLFK